MALPYIARASDNLIYRSYKRWHCHLSLIQAITLFIALTSDGAAIYRLYNRNGTPVVLQASLRPGVPFLLSSVVVKLNRIQSGASTTPSTNKRTFPTKRAWGKVLSSLHHFVVPRLYAIGVLLVIAYIIPIPGPPAGIAGAGSLMVATAASVVRKLDATDVAFWIALLVTLAGSMIPSLTMSTYCSE